MRCVECGRPKALEERGWVTVLSPSGEDRVRYCPDCIASLLFPPAAADAADNGVNDV